MRCGREVQAAQRLFHGDRDFVPHVAAFFEGIDLLDAATASDLSWRNAIMRQQAERLNVAAETYAAAGFSVAVGTASHLACGGALRTNQCQRSSR